MRASEPTWQSEDGRVQLWHGDCREILPIIGKVDAVITDPPYGVGIRYSQYADNLHDTIALVKQFIPLALDCSRIVAFTAGNWQTELSLYQTMPPKWRMCWYKGAQSCASPIGFCDWEAVLIYGNNIHCNAHDYFYATPEPMGANGHPCPKSFDFCRKLLGRLTKEGVMVCDPFMGSGTTGIACIRTGRRFIGIEIDEHYFNVARDRIERELRQQLLPL